MLLLNGHDTSPSIAAVSLLREEAALLDGSKLDREEFVRRWNAKVDSVGKALEASRPARTESEAPEKFSRSKRIRRTTS